jgi:nucleoside-diphosphate-sugar epimerase
MAKEQNHALVFGAAGLLGWATVNQLLSGYPASAPFTSVTAVLNRHVAKEDLHLPSGPNSPDLQIVSGIDLLQGSGEDLARQLQDKVPRVEGVTHVFYFGTSRYYRERYVWSVH